MDARLRVLTTYKLLNNTRYFRLRLCAGGVVTGVLAGVIISCFRLALTGAASLRANLQSLVFAGGYTPAIALFCGALLIAAALLAWLAKAEPQAAGSGIPQVKGAVLGVFKLRWLRILLVKFAACALAIGSGLSLGRAGPSIQMGAMAGQGVSRLLARPRIEERYLISGGAAWPQFLTLRWQALFSFWKKSTIIFQAFCCFLFFRHPWQQPLQAA